QLGHARESATPDALRRDLCEEAFDEIEPGRTRRREVQLEARMLGQPRLHLGGLVRPIVIEHEMHREVSKHGSIDPLQKANELFRPMPRLAFADDESALHVEGCEQRGGPMTLVVVRHRCGPTALQRQARLRAVKGLDLALLVDAQHQRPIWWAHIEANDIRDLLLEVRVVRYLEAAYEVRPEASLDPDALNACMADAHDLRHRSHAPVRRIRRR